MRPKLKNRIRTLRAESGKTQTELARIGGLSSAQWSSYETGSQRSPREHTLEKFAKAFGITVDELRGVE